jgi:hypothetical protein
VVKQEMAEKAGQVIEVESDEEDDPQPEVSHPSHAEMFALCQRLEGGCLQFGNADSTVPLDFVK